MKKSYLVSFICLPLFMVSLIASCSGQSPSNDLEINYLKDAIPKADAQIAKYVVEIFEDRKGNLWFGTMSKGVARYDGKSLTYFSMKDGLAGNTVASIAEDREGNLWFGTHSGLSKYNGKTFINFTKQEGLCHNRVSTLLIDRAGVFWVGTWGGVCRYSDGKFSDFPLPVPDVELLDYQTTMNWVTEIMEDKQGNIWFGRDGYGVCKYDGLSFQHFTKKDGLPSNNVQAIQEDGQGAVWFGTRVAEKDSPKAQERTGDGGLSRFDGQTIIQYAEPELEGLSKNDVYALYKDRKGNVWASSIDRGAYKYDGKSFANFKLKSGLPISISGPPFSGIQSILEDAGGNLWFGCSGGLFRLAGTGVVNVTKSGPWD